MSHAARTHPRTIAWTGLQDAFENLKPNATFTPRGLANEAFRLTGHRPSDGTARRFVHEALAGKAYDTGRVHEKAHIYRVGQPPAKAAPVTQEKHHSTGDAILLELQAIRGELAALRGDLTAALLQRAS